VPSLGTLIPPARRSIRTRLLLLALLPLGIVLPLIMAALAYWGGDYFDQLLNTKVRSDLAVANSYYERAAEGVGRSVAGQAAANRVCAPWWPGAGGRRRRWRPSSRRP